MPKLPVLSGREVVRGLGLLGFEVVGQKGSHREVRKGTFAAIPQQAGITIQDLMTALSH